MLALHGTLSYIRREYCMQLDAHNFSCMMACSKTLHLMQTVCYNVSISVTVVCSEMPAAAYALY